MNPQNIARVFGVLYLLTFITSIPAFFVFYAPVLDDPRYIVGAGADTSVASGALLETNLATAAAAYIRRASGKKYLRASVDPSACRASV